MRKLSFPALILILSGLAATAFGQSAWTNYAKSAFHGAESTTAAQPLNSIHWQTPVDLHPQDALGDPAARSNGGDELLIHYGSPLITVANTVILPLKTGSRGSFTVNAHDAASGDLVWSLPSDY